MTARRKIAGWLRRVARAIDDAPRGRWPNPADIEARTAAIFAIPRKINRHAAKTFFERGVETNPLVVAQAAQIEALYPGCYAGNDAMVAAIAEHRGRLA